ncbi:hypothetical protein PCASD_07228 [Puccinia coronata f. sp. avenae]|uniref:Uncharacterized protein n=1 Tax=Puccinia coronata f. sp. avenae TaxID=200324 RepID=A0A2N5UYL7_9BASI|nr:hypothetical protein PCASD_07228 [Puccinia coronata f. sp. avenae]
MPQQPWELNCCGQEVFSTFAYRVLPPPVEMLLGQTTDSGENNGTMAAENKTLGFVPALASIEEESEEINQENNQEDCSIAAKEEVVSDPDNNNDQLDPDNDDSNVLPPSQNSIRIYITSSAAKSSKFATWSKKLEYSGPSLIAGYGIRWNIKFQSRD